MLFGDDFFNLLPCRDTDVGAVVQHPGYGCRGDTRPSGDIINSNMILIQTHNRYNINIENNSLPFIFILRQNSTVGNKKYMIIRGNKFPGESCKKNYFIFINRNNRLESISYINNLTKIFDNH